MALSVASGIFRRLQNSIYTPRQPEEGLHGTFANAADDDSASMTTGEPSDDLSPALESSSGSEQPATLSLSSFDDALRPTLQFSSGLDSLPLGEIHETSTRRRQPSNPSISAPDVNTQALLRKRISEIQNLNLPERDKAQRVQVQYTFWNVP
jgi:hypothetical protein